MVLVQPGAPGTGLSLGSQSPGLASVPEIIQGMGSLGCPTATGKATVASHSLSGVLYLRDSPVPSTGDGAQVGTLDPPLHSPEGSGHHSTENAPKREINTLLRALGLSQVLFSLSAQPCQYLLSVRCLFPAFHVWVKCHARYKRGARQGPWH